MVHREMKALADNAEAVRALAIRLLRLRETDAGVSWTDWELDFLENRSRQPSGAPLTTRQAEVLIELRNEAQSYTSLDGLSVTSLIAACWLARHDLDEEGEAFIGRLKAAGARSLKRAEARRLLACARELGVIERYVALD